MIRPQPCAWFEVIVARDDAFIALDPSGAPIVSSGFNARFASHPLAGNMNIDPTSLPAYRAVAEHLLRKRR